MFGTFDTMPSRSGKKVKIECKPDQEPICVTEWSSSGVPVSESKLEMAMKSVDKQIKLECRDPLTNVKYLGDQFIPKHQKYMMLVVEGDKASLKPCVYFRMKPKVDLPDRKSGILSQLSKKEQLDACNEKFGSKQSLKRIEQKKKFAIAFGEDDYAEVKDKTAKIANDTSKSTESLKKTDLSSSDILNDTFLMPPRNPNAASNKEVYNINDIVPESIVELVKSSYDLENFIPVISSPLIQHFSTNAKTDLDKVCCIYLDILIKLKGLRNSELGKAEYMGIPGVLSSELQQSIFANYTVSSLRNNKAKPTLTDKCKDKIMIHGIILSIHLNRFRPLLISALAQAFQVSTIKLRKLGGVVGCHVDVTKDKTDRVFIFRLPLYSLEVEKKYKRRRTG